VKARALSVALVATVVVSLAASLRAHQQDATAPTSRLQDRIFQSESLSRPMKYRILLPADYFETTRSYPVLYLLHGWHGDYQNWSALTTLAHYAEALPLIVIMPDAGDSWYVDSATSAST
jgi:enterochelin esterase-like enzyme